MCGAAILDVGSHRCSLAYLGVDEMVKVKGHHNVILNTFQKRKGKGIYFGTFLVILGL